MSWNCIAITTFVRSGDVSTVPEAVAEDVNAFMCTIKSIAARSVCWVTALICFFKTGIKCVAQTPNASHAC